MNALQENVLEVEDAAQVAAEFSDEWRQVNRSLVSIIGQRGIIAMLNRALYLASLKYPFLAIVLEPDLHSTLNFKSLETALSRESIALAVSANQYFYCCFQNLLSSLIGESLASRLLTSIPTTGSGSGLFAYENIIQTQAYRANKRQALTSIKTNALVRARPIKKPADH